MVEFYRILTLMNAFEAGLYAMLTLEMLCSPIALVVKSNKRVHLVLKMFSFCF